MKLFAIYQQLFQAQRMTQPLALVLYEKLLPGSQLVNRLQDLNYRVQHLAEAAGLVTTARQCKPMLVLADLQSTRNDVCAALATLKREPDTAHLPVIAFAADDSVELKGAVEQAGVTLLVSDTAILNHLPECLQQALQVD